MICFRELLTLSFCRLLTTFANSLDTDQDRQNVGPDLDQNCLISDSVPEHNSHTACR